MGPAWRLLSSAPVAACSAPIKNKNFQFLFLIPLHPLVRVGGCSVKDGKLLEFRVTLKVTFEIE
jgi:hypothetical protein